MPSPGAITSAAMTAANRSTLNKRNKRVVDEENEDVGEDEVMANAEGAESVESTVAADDQVYCFCQKPSHGLVSFFHLRALPASLILRPYLSADGRVRFAVMSIRMVPPRMCRTQ